MINERDCPASVHIVDDDALLRDVLDSLFRSVGFKTHCYASAYEFLRRKPESGPGCIVLDVRLSGSNGLDLQAQLATIGVHLPVVFLTGYGDVPMTVRAMKAGAADFLQKPFRAQDLLDAVSKAIDRERIRMVGARQESEIRERFSTLTLREQQVMRLVTSGKLNKQIAGELGLSEITVKMHRGSMMRKMAARTLTSLVRMADLLAATQKAMPPGLTHRGPDMDAWN